MAKEKRKTMSNEPEDFMKNFALIIPQEAFEVPEMVEDPRGAPILKGCDAIGGCACTGRCKEVIGWTQDPEALAAHREYIKWYNTPVKIDYGERKWEGNTEIWEIKKDTE